MNLSTFDAIQQKNFEIGALLLRLIFGVLFFFAGLGKFIIGYKAVVEDILSSFHETYLPTWLTVPYLHALPFIELMLGVFLLLGLFSRIMLIVAALLLLTLALGKMIQGDQATVAYNFMYMAICIAAILLNSLDKYSVDRLVRK